ncbi:MAG: hypothetical protein HUU06_10405 [Planctomycetaceae bacterium]|nr:hypothetical protein [Planctomycetota bacterium]NUN53180.1 hypothetical protein [Planctomycetaceae bacterium]
MRSRASLPGGPSAGLPLPLHVLVHPEGRWWLAHCLELDIVSQHDTIVGARRGLEDALELLLEDAAETGGPRGLLRPAPASAWAGYRRARREGNPAGTRLPGVVLDVRVRADG